MRHILALAVAGLTLVVACSGTGPSEPLDASLQSARWVAVQDGRITLFAGADAQLALTTGHRDWKPVWSATGDQITFFRAVNDSGPFETWRTKICVVRADGTGYRELTDGTHADFNPTWTRDGSNRILFNRFAEGGDTKLMEMYTTSPDASPGDEVPLPHVGRSYQWVDSGLKDGRLFVDGIDFVSAPTYFEIDAYLLAPDGAGGWTYQNVQRPLNLAHVWHKLTVSPSETRVAYMLDNNGHLGEYADDVLYWAEFDAEARVVNDPVAITLPTGGACVNEYPRWSADEKYIIYDSSCATGFPAVYAYRMEDGAVMLLAGTPGMSVYIASFEDVPQ